MLKLATLSLVSVRIKMEKVEIKDEKKNHPRSLEARQRRNKRKKELKKAKASKVYQDKKEDCIAQEQRLMELEKQKCCSPKSR